MWFGALVSNIGTWMETVALGYYVAHTTGKVSWSAIIAAAGFIPGAILGPIGAAMADRLNRKKVIILTNIAAGLIAAFVATWVGSGRASPAGLALSSFVTGSVFAFGFPSFQTALPDLVPREDLVSAVGLSNAQWNLGRIIGPTFAGLAIAFGGVQTALWCNAASFLAVVIAVMLVTLPKREGSKRPVFSALADGIRFARGHADMRRMLAVMFATILIASPFIAFVPQIATNVFHGGPRSTSVLVTAQGIGAVTAAFTLGSMSKRLGTWVLLFGTVGLLAPALVLYGVAPRLWLAAVALVVVGLAYGWAFTSFASIAQLAAPDEMRGRVLSVNSFILGVFYPVGTLIQGQIADRTSLRWITSGSGVVLAAAVGLLAMRNRRVQTQVALSPEVEVAR